MGEAQVVRLTRGRGLPGIGRGDGPLLRLIVIAVLVTLLPACGTMWLAAGLPPPSALYCAVPDEIPPRLPVRGVNLVGFQTGEYVGPDARLGESLGAFSALGGNWVAVNFWWFQDNATSAEITPDPALYTISDEAIVAAVQAAHDQGLNVLLRPVVDLRDGARRGTIQPSPAWFNAYGGFIQHFAALAEQWQVAAFSVGVELSATQPDEADWRQLIAAVRTTYSGALVYCANHDGVADLAWWDALDIIGVDAYYAVERRPDADAATMTCAWSYWLDRLERDTAARYPGKPVWLTEVGALAARGSARAPACYSGSCSGLVDVDTVDYAEQAHYYRAALLAAGQRPWLSGVFWWSWYPDPGAAYVRATDYSPQGKPAADVLREFWTGDLSGM